MAHIFKTLLPNIGLLGTVAVTAIFSDIKELYQSPSWALQNHWEIYVPLVVGVNLGLGFSSHLVSKKGFLSATIPLGAYLVQLVLYWAHVPILYGIGSPRWAFVDMAFTTITATFTTILFWNLDEIAGALAIPNLLYLAYNTCYDFWVYRATIRLRANTKPGVKQDNTTKDDDKNTKA